MWNIPIGNEKGNEISITHTKNSDTGMTNYVNTVLVQQRLKQITNPKNNIQPKKQIAYNTYQQKLISQLMAYLHASMNAPAVKTYINAIKNNWLATFPGLSFEAV